MSRTGLRSVLDEIDLKKSRHQQEQPKEKQTHMQQTHKHRPKGKTQNTVSQHYSFQKNTFPRNGSPQNSHPAIIKTSRMDLQWISYALRWHWWHDTKVSCHNTTNTQFIKAKAHPGPCPLAWHSGFTTSKQVQWAGTGAGSSRQQQQTAGESRKQHKKMKQKRICHVWNFLEHEEVQKKETRGVWSWTVIKFWPAEHILNWETERHRDRFGSKEEARRESRQEEAENWSQSELKNKDRDCSTEKAEENQGLEKYRKNQSSEGNQIGIFFYLWFYVEISFSKGQQIL